MSLGARFPLQSSASQDLSLFGAHPVGMTAQLCPRLARLSSDFCSTDAAVSLVLTLEKTSHILLRPHSHLGPDKPYFPDVIIAPVPVRDPLP